MSPYDQQQTYPLAPKPPVTPQAPPRPQANVPSGPKALPRPPQAPGKHIPNPQPPRHIPPDTPQAPPGPRQTYPQTPRHSPGPPRPQANIPPDPQAHTPRYSPGPPRPQANIPPGPKALPRPPQAPGKHTPSPPGTYPQALPRPTHAPGKHTPRPQGTPQAPPGPRQTYPQAPRHSPGPPRPQANIPPAPQAHTPRHSPGLPSPQANIPPGPKALPKPPQAPGKHTPRPQGPQALPRPPQAPGKHTPRPQGTPQAPPVPRQTYPQPPRHIPPGTPQDPPGPRQTYPQLHFDEPFDDQQQAQEEVSEFACSYCGIHNPACVAKCLNANKWFCNGKVNSSGSCIIMHLVKSKFKEVQLHKDSPLGDTVLECYASGTRNVFVLGFVPVKSENTVVLLARDTTANHPTIKDLTLDLTQWQNDCGRPLSDTVRARQLTLAQINKLEDIWKSKPNASVDEIDQPSPDGDVTPQVAKVALRALPLYQAVFKPRLNPYPYPVPINAQAPAPPGTRRPQAPGRCNARNRGPQRQDRTPQVTAARKEMTRKPQAPRAAMPRHQRPKLQGTRTPSAPRPAPPEAPAHPRHPRAATPRHPPPAARQAPHIPKDPAVPERRGTRTPPARGLETQAAAASHAQARTPRDPRAANAQAHHAARNAQAPAAASPGTRGRNAQAPGPETPRHQRVLNAQATAGATPSSPASLNFHSPLSERPAPYVSGAMLRRAPAQSGFKLMIYQPLPTIPIHLTSIHPVISFTPIHLTPQGGAALMRRAPVPSQCSALVKLADASAPAMKEGPAAVTTSGGGTGGCTEGAARYFFFPSGWTCTCGLRVVVAGVACDGRDMGLPHAEAPAGAWVARGWLRAPRRAGGVCARPFAGGDELKLKHRTPSNRSPWEMDLTPVGYSVEFVWKATSFDRMRSALDIFAKYSASISAYLYHSILGHRGSLSHGVSMHQGRHTNVPHGPPRERDGYRRLSECDGGWMVEWMELMNGVDGASAMPPRQAVEWHAMRLDDCLESWNIGLMVQWSQECNLGLPTPVAAAGHCSIVTSELRARHGGNADRSNDTSLEAQA
eukprot:gene30131-35107_t